MRPALFLFLMVLALIMLAPMSAIHARAWSMEDALKQLVVVYTGDGYGTGWWADHSHVVTAAHVVAGKPNITLIRGAWSSPANTVYIDQELDVAVLLVLKPPRWARGLELAREVGVGQEVAVAGYPVEVYYESNRDLAQMSVAPRLAYGHVAWISPTRDVAEIDIATDAGNSGGPVLDAERGGVVGIVSYARHGEVTQLYYIVTVDAVQLALSKAGVNPRYDSGFNTAVFLAALGAGIIIALLIMVARGGSRSG